MRAATDRRRFGTGLLVLCGLGLTGCPHQASSPSLPISESPGAAAGALEPTPIELTSTAFGAGQAIPPRYAEDGEDLSPPLAWSGLPEATRELALICDDPDAPSPKRPAAEPWVHWVLYKIPPGAGGLPEGIPAAARLEDPPGAIQGNNSWPTIGYRGPAPPPGSGTHRYFFKLYALDVELDVAPGLDKKALLEAMSGHVLGEGELMGTYER